MTPPHSGYPVIFSSFACQVKRLAQDFLVMRKTFEGSQKRRARRAAAFVLVALGIVQVCLAQNETSAYPTDPQISAALRQVSAERIRQTDEKLVSFGNRSTLSAQDDDSIKAGKGIGAAREWIKSEFELYSKNAAAALK